MLNRTFCHAYLHRSYQHCPLGTSRHEWMQNLTFRHAYLHIAIKTLESHPKCQPTQFQRHSQTLSTKPHHLLFRCYCSQHSIKELWWATLTHLCPWSSPCTIVQQPQHFPVIVMAQSVAHGCKGNRVISIVASLQEHAQSNFMVAVLQENLCMGPEHSWKKTTELKEKAWWHSVWPTPTFEPFLIAEHVQLAYVHILKGWPIAVAVGASYCLWSLNSFQH